jgi:hypothetical protein
MDMTMLLRKALTGTSLVVALGTVSACGSDADIRTAEQNVATARAQLQQDERSGDQAHIAADSERLNAAASALGYLRMNWYGPRGKGW